jgi:redox-sensitive bicupin YhaK (pirin superfamily)
MQIRRGSERGYADHGWLKTFHTFSFADYHDPEHMGFSALRVLNEDRVQGGRGLGAHPHRDMEIVSYVLEGQLQHKDSMGTGSIIRPGDVQRMSAGTGVLHSEFNPLRAEPVHFLQIWIIPDRAGHSPSYAQKKFPNEEKAGHLRLIVSKDGRDGSVSLHQDVSIYATVLDTDQSVEHAVVNHRNAWVQVVRGKLDLNGESLEAGDGAAFVEEGNVRLSGSGEALVFDLP